MNTHSSLISRIERALDRAAQSRIDGVASLPGNPLGIEVQQFGAVTATIVQQPLLYYGYYNAVRGVYESQPEELKRAFRWMDSAGMKPRITTPPLLTEDLVTTLADAGLTSNDTLSVSFGASAAWEGELAPADITVAELPLGQRDDFARLWSSATGADHDSERLCEAEFRDWRVYVGRIEGTAAAYGCLYIDNGVAVLASGWSHPDARARGLQTALIRQRITDSGSAGCDLIVSSAVPSSVSERNLRRAGLNSGYPQSVWT